MYKVAVHICDIYNAGCCPIVSNVYVNIPVVHPVVFHSAVELGGAQLSPFGQD